MSGLFGELYLASTKPFLSQAATELDAAFLAAQFQGGPVLDVGCGHGRHLAMLKGRAQVVGVDLDVLSLAEAKTHAPVVRADFFRLPFAPASFGGAYSWYNTLFTFDDADIRRLVLELARCLRPKGRLIVHNSNIAKALADPVARFEGLIEGQTHLVEETVFDASACRDRVTRSLTFGDGRQLKAEFTIRYYRLDEWSALLHEAGFVVTSVHGSPEGGGQPFVYESSPDLIVGAERRA